MTYYGLGLEVPGVQVRFLGGEGRGETGTTELAWLEILVNNDWTTTVRRPLRLDQVSKRGDLEIEGPLICGTPAGAW